MNSDTQLKVQSYLDNELSAGEARQVASLLSSDAQAKELYENLRLTRELIVANEPEVKLEESRDFYWSKIKRQIEQAEREPAPRHTTPWWIRAMAPLAGTAALFALLISIMNPKTEMTPRSTNQTVSNVPLHGEVEDLVPEMTSVTFRSEQNGVTVVWLSASK